MMDRFDLEVLILTCGVQGSYVFAGDIRSFLDTPHVKVADTVGAGDSYIAAFTYGVSLGESISQCMDRGKKRATEIIRQFNPYK